MPDEDSDASYHRIKADQIIAEPTSMVTTIPATLTLLVIEALSRPPARRRRINPQTISPVLTIAAAIAEIREPAKNPRNKPNRTITGMALNKGFRRILFSSLEDFSTGLP
jgi:hypothetical protein